MGLAVLIPRCLIGYRKRTRWGWKFESLCKMLPLNESVFHSNSSALVHWVSYAMLGRCDIIHLSSLGPQRIHSRRWRDRWPLRRPRGLVGLSVRAGPSQTPRQSPASHGSTAGHGYVWWKLKDGLINHDAVFTLKRFPYFMGLTRRAPSQYILSTYGDFHVKDKTAVRTSYL